MISIPIVVLVAIAGFILLVAGGPIAIVVFVFGTMIYGLTRNGPAVFRTFLSSFIPLTVVLGSCRKKISVVYPCTKHFFEFRFHTRGLRDIMSEIPQPLESTEVIEILKTPRARFWLKIRFATRLILPDQNEDGYLFVEIGSSQKKDVYYRAKDLKFGRVAVINIIRSEKLGK